MTRYLLHTNVVSDLVRHPGGTVAHARRQAGAANVATSLVVAAELRFGAAKSGAVRLARQTEEILAVFEVLPLAPPVDAIYAELRWWLQQHGALVGNNDLWVAAHTLALDRVLVTANLDEFGRVPGLRVENWLAR